MAGAQKVRRDRHRAGTRVSNLPLTSCHSKDKYLAAKLGNVGLCFNLAMRRICPSSTPAPLRPDSVQHVYCTQTQQMAGWLFEPKQVTNMKSQGGSREFQTHRGCFSVSGLQRCAGERVHPRFFAGTLFLGNTTYCCFTGGKKLQRLASYKGS